MEEFSITDADALRVLDAMVETDRKLDQQRLKELEQDSDMPEHLYWESLKIQVRMGNISQIGAIELMENYSLRG